MIEIVLLQDIGLISGESLNITSKLSPEKKVFAIYDNTIIFAASESENNPFIVPIYKLSSIGEEIFSIIPDKKCNIDNLRPLATFLNSKDITLSYSELVKIDEKEILYNASEIKEFFDNVK